MIRLSAIRCRTLAAVFGISVGIGASVGFAQEIPILDVDGLCASRLHCPALPASCEPPSRATALKACVYTQQTAYDRAKAIWPKLPPEARTDCAGRLHGEFLDYRILTACAALRLRVHLRESGVERQGRFRP